jgi:uncharacterized protein (DUF169 family)
MRVPEGVTAVGVEVIRGEKPYPEGLPINRGISYCEAVSRAKREPLLVTRDSIEVCKWAPAVLGFKEVESGFERKLLPRLEPGTRAVLLAPLDSFPRGHEPEVVILQGPADTLWGMMEEAGRDNWVTTWSSEIDKSALGLKSSGLPAWKVKAVSRVNRALTILTPHPLWQRFTRTAFRSRTLSRMLEAVIAPFMASMSVCRNSTVIPLTEGVANLSFFCAGGITWGGNPSDHMTCGVPAGMLKG